VAPRTPKTIAKSAQIPPVPTAEDVREDTREKANAAKGAKLAQAEQDAAKAGLIGRLVGWGEGSKENIVFLLVALLILICGIELLATSDADAKHQMGEIFKFLSGALVGFLIRGSKR
jgi:hypothetical protein